MRPQLAATLGAMGGLQIMSVTPVIGGSAMVRKSCADRFNVLAVQRCDYVRRRRGGVQAQLMSGSCVSSACTGHASTVSYRSAAMRAKPETLVHGCTLGFVLTPPMA
jgi:hypothetical protein